MNWPKIPGTEVKKMSEQSQIDKDEALEEMQEQYREETGEHLPDHVLENYDEFFSLGPTVDDMQGAFERGRKASPEEYTKREMQKIVATTMVLSAVVAFGSAFAIASSFGMAVAAVVCVGIGFVIGGLLT